MALTWDGEDALGDASSGAALLASKTGATTGEGSASLGASWCIAVRGGQIVLASASLRIEAGQASDGMGGVSVSFFDAAGCTASSTFGFRTLTPIDAALGSWLTLRAGLKTDPGARSAQVSLVIDEQDNAASFRARFDNVLVKQQKPAED